VVTRPNEPTEEYQEEIKVKEKSEYKTRLHDIEYTDAPKIKGEEFHSTNANMSLLKELLKDRKDQDFEKLEKAQEQQSKDDQATPSPYNKKGK